MTFNDNCAGHKNLEGYPMIRINLKFLGTLLLLALSLLDVKAKEWRGIVPLKTTKTAVERLLGKPNQLGRYDIGNERASILYSDGPCESTHQVLPKANCECLVAKATVLKIFVTLDSPVKVSKLGIDKNKYQRTAIYAYRPTATYSDFTEGVVYTIRESDDSITNIDYLPSAKDCEAVIKTQTPATPSNAWQGIVPLRSIRANVEQLLGPATSSHGDVYVYGTAENRVDISYTADPCKPGNTNPRGTSADIVLKVTVSPRKILLIQNLGLDKAKYKRIQDIHPENWVHYINSAEGITVDAVVNNDCEEVISIVYQPTPRDRELRCGRSQKIEAKKVLKLRRMRYAYERASQVPHTLKNLIRNTVKSVMS
jgi:hypothetical protein